MPAIAMAPAVSRSHLSAAGRFPPLYPSAITPTPILLTQDLALGTLGPCLFSSRTRRRIYYGRELPRVHHSPAVPPQKKPPPAVCQEVSRMTASEWIKECTDSMEEINADMRRLTAALSRRCGRAVFPLKPAAGGGRTAGTDGSARVQQEQPLPSQLGSSRKSLPLRHTPSLPLSTAGTPELQATARFKAIAELPVADMSPPAIAIAPDPSCLDLPAASKTSPSSRFMFWAENGEADLPLRRLCPAGLTPPASPPSDPTQAWLSAKGEPDGCFRRPRHDLSPPATSIAMAPDISRLGLSAARRTSPHHFAVSGRTRGMVRRIRPLCGLSRIPGGFPFASAHRHDSAKPGLPGPR